MFLTERQLSVLTFIREFIDDKGISPTLDEMSQYFGVSKITIYEHVNALEKKGAIHKTPNMARSIQVVDDEPPAARPSGLTVMGRIAAGSAIEAIEDSEVFTFDSLAPAQADHYMLRVEGESMIGDHICPGDLVIVEPGDTADDGDIVVALLPDDATAGRGATLKRFYRERDHIRLQPSNPTMEPIRARQVEIRGRVVGVVRPNV